MTLMKHATINVQDTLQVLPHLLHAGLPRPVCVHIHLQLLANGPVAVDVAQGRHHVIIRAISSLQVALWGWNREGTSLAVFLHLHSAMLTTPVTSSSHANADNKSPKKDGYRS